MSASSNVSGHWIFKADRDFRGNAAVPVECSLAQLRSELTVTCGTGTEMKGKVSGRELTWGFEKSGIPPMTDDVVVLAYTAEINEAGTGLKGTWRLTSSVLDEKGEFEAHKKQ
jgi:hypothetical protein